MLEAELNFGRFGHRVARFLYQPAGRARENDRLLQVFELERGHEARGYVLCQKCIQTCALWHLFSVELPGRAELIHKHSKRTAQKVFWIGTCTVPFSASASNMRSAS